MTTKQTINGVPRELIEKAMLACFEAGHGITHDELRALLDAPAVESKPFRVLVRCCHGPVSKLFEKANESAWPDIESARQYFGAENEIDIGRAGRLVYISPGEWLATPLYAEQPAPVAVVPKSECPNCLGDAMFGCDACTPDPVAVGTLEIVGRQCFPSETMKKIPNYRTEPWVDGDVHQSPSVPDLYHVEPLVRLSDVTRLNIK